jgi:hypothetical protein
MSKRGNVVPIERVEKRIVFLRSQKVIVDSDLAALYDVPVKRLNEQVRRNGERFPSDFAFQLTPAEYESLRSHFATLDRGRGKHRKYLPWAFTEHGALMAASVLNSPRAVEMSILIVRVFVRLRRILASHSKLARKFEEMEKRYDAQFRIVFDAIRELIEQRAPAAAPGSNEEPGRRIGFQLRERRSAYRTRREG